MDITMINFKTDAALKRQAQKKVKELGISLSAYLNAMLRKLVRVQDIKFIEEEVVLEPTEWLKKDIRQAQKEMAEGDYISFNSWEEEKAYLDKLIADTEKREQENWLLETFSKAPGPSTKQDSALISETPRTFSEKSFSPAFKQP